MELICKKLDLAGARYQHEILDSIEAINDWRELDQELSKMKLENFGVPATPYVQFRLDSLFEDMVRNGHLPFEVIACLSGHVEKLTPTRLTLLGLHNLLNDEDMW